MVPERLAGRTAIDIRIALGLKHRCTTGPQRRITRWEHEHMLVAVQKRLDENPLFAAEVTAIGNGFELVDAENGLRLLRGSTGSRFSQRHNVNRQICDVCSR